MTCSKRAPNQTYTQGENGMTLNIENLTALLNAREKNVRALAKTYEASGDMQSAENYKREALTLSSVNMMLTDKKLFNDIAEIYLTSKHSLHVFVVRNNKEDLPTYASQAYTWVTRSEAKRFLNYEEANAMRHSMAKEYHIPLKDLEVFEIEGGHIYENTHN